MNRFDVVAVAPGETPPLPDDAEMAEIMRLSASSPWGPSAPARARPEPDEAAEAIAAKAMRQIARFGRQRRWGV